MNFPKYEYEKNEILINLQVRKKMNFHMQLILCPEEIRNIMMGFG